MKIRLFHLFAAVILTMLSWLVAGFLFGFPSPGDLIVLTLIAWLLASIVVLAAKTLSHRVWILAGVVTLAAMFLPDSIILEISARMPPTFGDPTLFTYLLTLPAALVVGALLLYSASELYEEWQRAGATASGGSPEQRKHIAGIAAVCIGLCAVLVGKAVYDFFGFMIWDDTGDSLGNFWLTFPVLVVLFSSAILFIILPGKTKLAGFLYLLVIPALIAVSARAQSVDYRALTEERAQHVRQAVETYYAREGSYPQDLRQLTPFYTLSFPGPVIMYGQDWCYQGGQDYYRLGYLDREHWSSPILFGRVYSAKGHYPLKVDICQPSIDTYRAQHPDWDRGLEEYGKPTPTPDIGD